MARKSLSFLLLALLLPALACGLDDEGVVTEGEREVVVEEPVGDEDAVAGEAGADEDGAGATAEVLAIEGATAFAEKRAPQWKGR